MSKDSILDYSITASENQDINSISTLGTAKPNVIDNIVRAQMSHIAQGLVSRRVEKDTAYTAVKADHNQVIDFTETTTLTTSSAATLTDGWQCYVYSSGGDVTINPNGSETVNGDEFIIIREGTFGVLRVFDGNFLFNGFTAGSSGSTCFFATKTTSQGISTAAVLAFADEKVDVGDYYDTGTSRWTPPAGLYEVTLSCQISTSYAPVPRGDGGEILFTSEGATANIAIRKNGTIISSASVEIWQSASNNGHATITAIVETNGTDYIDAYGYGQYILVDGSNPGGWVGASTFSGKAI